MRLLFILVVLFASGFSSQTLACDSSSNCQIADDRHYRIHLPKNHDGKTKIGAIFFAHGLGGNAVGIVQNKNLKRMADKLNVALVALKSKSNDWNVKNSPAGRSDRSSNEFSYIDNVIGDVTRRFLINKKQLMLAGVSVGGTFTWTMACTGKGRFAAFMPISGTYWLQPPKSCSAKPTNIIHVHGTADLTVPLNGRRVGSSAHSDVNEVINAYAKIGKYKRAGKATESNLKCVNRRNPRDKILDFCLHNGGHSFRTKDIEFAWKRFRSLGIL